MTQHFVQILSGCDTGNAFLRMTRISRTQSAGLILLLAVFLVPTFTRAQQASPAFSRQGIFGCNRNNAALSGSVGAFSATGGVYVPVADYTVELNTGTLVYLECVLRGIVNREGESVTTASIQRIEQFMTSGQNNGDAMFQVSSEKEKLQATNERALPVLIMIRDANDALTRANPSMVQEVSRGYLGDQQPFQQILCPYDVDLNTCDDEYPPSTDCINASLDTRCFRDFGSMYRRSYLNQRAVSALQDRKDCLDWGRGFYCKDTLDQHGNRIIETPSSVVAELNNQALTSGFRKIENANNVDQMVGALYSGLGTQVLTGSGGLSGLTKAIGNQPSYLAQLTAESSAGLRAAATNAALQNLAGARQIEMQYNSVVNSIANNLTATINELHSTESQCFNLIAYNTSALHVCADPPTGNSCKDTAGSAIKIATSTAFSKPIIDREIAPIATEIIGSVQKSDAALVLIDQLIAGVTNTTSQNVQRGALLQFDQLVAQGKLHVQPDVTAMQGRKSAIADRMTEIVTSSKVLWADNETLDVATGSGWCNFKRQPVIDHWTQQWK